MLQNLKSKIITRFAPSPTGLLHVGSARTALFNYLFAKQKKGKLILRIEDTDKERSTKEFEGSILEGLEWLGIKCDETYKQSERTEIYKKHLQKLIDEGKAYVSEEKEGERKEVIRFKNPNQEITFSDLVRGQVSFDTTELGDFVIAKSLDEPIYHFAVVVDDFEMGVTHVIRGEDGISNTPRQILLIEALGAKIPEYAHIPLILAEDKSKLSKRHGAVSVTEFKEKGYLPQAMINFLALIGWNPGDDREIFTTDELVKEFDLKKVQKGGAIFNVEKLNWINKEHIKLLSPESQRNLVEQFMPKEIFDLPQYSSERLKKLMPTLIERINFFGELEVGELDYFFDQPKYTDGLLIKGAKIEKSELPAIIDKLIELLQKSDAKNFSADSVKDTVWGFAEEKGRATVLWPMRVALSGKEKSPDPFTLASVLGKDETLKRLENAKEF